jgi:phosphotransferase system HPr (HPr) family protein
MTTTDASAGEQHARLIISHPAGLHLRPAALFVRTAGRFASQIRARNLSRDNSPEVDAKSILGIMQVAVSQGDQLLVRAWGADASEAIEALTALVKSNFEEQPS